MKKRFLLVALVALAVAPLAGQSPRSVRLQPDGKYKAPRTPWGDPDLQGVWPSTDMVGVPLQRASNFGERNLLTDEEFTARQAAAARQTDEDNAEFSIDKVTAEQEARGTVGGPVSPPPHWLERGRPSYQASLIVDPPDGRMPPQTPEAAERVRALAARRAGHGPADTYEDRSLYDQCITRGVLGSILPVIYNNGNQIIQAPGLVVLRNEMIHETRFFYTDGRPHISSKIRSYMGDSRARWDGDSLVVETTNMFDRNGVGGNGGGQALSDALKITERFRRIDADTIEYRATIDDPKTYTRPFTLQFPWRRDNNYGMFEYACHEGNHSLFNILSGARADDREAAAGSTRP
jgi:hypothetical protein